MPEYPTDLDLNQNKDIYLDGANDLALTGGVEQLQQSVAIDVFDVLQQFVGGRTNGRNIGLLEQRVRESLEADPQLSAVRNVTVQTFNRDSGVVTIDVSVVDDEDFTLEMI